MRRTSRRRSVGKISLQMRIHHLVFAVLMVPCALAKDVPIDKESIVGDWKLIGVQTDDENAKAKALSGKKELDFRRDGTMRDVGSYSGKEALPKSGSYRIEADQVFVKIGQGDEEPAKVVVRDGCLVVIRPEGAFSELVFERIQRQTKEPNQPPRMPVNGTPAAASSAKATEARDAHVAPPPGAAGR